ncbi:MAG: four helix bundle suffix domain-containing protein [Lentisphaeria bacterium]|nr:four helix bundle suffix domain-containing protein [Lentisphaeria bacterium]
MSEERIFRGHGDYRNLLSYRRAEVIYLATYCFVERFLEKSDRTSDQMIQAARSGKQNIVEGSLASAGSRESEIFLTNVAYASFGELLEDYLDYLKVRKLRIWEAESEKVKFVRGLCRVGDGGYEEYRRFIESRPAEVVANIVVTLIHQVQLLLEHQIDALEKKFLKEGGVKERMTKLRIAAREEQRRKKDNGKDIEED